MNRILIKELKENELSKISGFVTKIRDTKYMVFLILKDRTGEIQVSFEKSGHEELIQEVLKSTIGSVVSITGKMVLSEYVKNGGKEFIPETFKIESLAAASPIEDGAEIDTRLDYRWLDLRSDKNTLIFRIQSALVKAMREYLYNNGFIEIHTPKLIGAASESGADVFEIKYFDRNAYLAQSPQFYKQMAMAAGFDRIFEVGPVFRAEKSFTNRHSTEFTCFDLEFSYIDSYEDVMEMEENLIKYAFKSIEPEFGEIIKNVFGSSITVPDKPFPRVKLKDLYEEIEKRYGYKVSEEEKVDLTSEAEKLGCKYAMEEFGSEFIFVTDYEPDKRAFYHMRDENGKPLGYDLLWRGVEITTGAQREHRYEILKRQAEEKGLGEDVKFYLEFFKYGCPPHGGFGLGVDRITMLLLGLPSLKETEFLFRGPNRLEP